MFRAKDFILMDVKNTKGKKLGYIKDILINFNINQVVGFSLANYSFFGKELKVFKEDIIAFNEYMIVSRSLKKEAFSFSKLKTLDVIDVKGNIIGVVEEIIFNKENFKIKGLILSTGFMKSMSIGKRVIIPKEFIVGDDNILFYSNDANSTFYTKIHNLKKEDDNLWIKTTKNSLF